MEKDRIFIGLGLIAIIIATSIIIYVKRDDFFNQVVEIKYPDDCIEKYVNNNLTTPICKEGRAMEEVVRQQQDIEPPLYPFSNGQVN